MEEDAGLSYCELVIIKAGVEEDAGLSYCELVIIKAGWRKMLDYRTVNLL